MGTAPPGKYEITSEGQLENTEMWEPEQEGIPKTEVKVLDWAAHHSTIVLSSSQAPQESGYERLSRSNCPIVGQIDA